MLSREDACLSLGQLQPGCHLLLPLCPPVLEPRLDLHLGQAKGFGELEAFRDREVFVGLERENKLSSKLQSQGFVMFFM